MGKNNLSVPGALFRTETKFTHHNVDESVCVCGYVAAIFVCHENDHTLWTRTIPPATERSRLRKRHDGKDEYICMANITTTPTASIKKTLLCYFLCY